MQSANKSGYLINRTKQVMRVTQLEPKDLSLDMLMTAYASLYLDGAAGNDKRISMKVPALATHLAEKLMQDKFVIINDPDFNKWYWVKAFGQDLIAVYYSIGPWLNVHGVKATSEDILRELNILTPTTTDLKVIDRIFGFRPIDPKEDDHTPATAVVNKSDNQMHWMWHSGTRAAERKQQDREVESPTAEVLAPSHIVEAAGSVGEPGREVEMGSNQMQKAFQSAGVTGHQSRRQERRHAERRAHELNQPDDKKSS
ncbi:hypothetical protein [Burkholderia phage FLC6]|nr:hypothetical protein [Burkholderia phage FLC6]